MTEPDDFTIEELKVIPRVFAFCKTSGYFNRDLMQRLEDSFNQFLEEEELYEVQAQEPTN